jgi:hypothetical protein
MRLVILLLGQLAYLWQDKKYMLDYNFFAQENYHGVNNFAGKKYFVKILFNIDIVKKVV